MWILITVKIVSWRSSTDSCRSLNADRPLFRALNAVTIVSKQFRTLIYFYILNYVMFTGKIKLNYLVIKVVLSTVIKGQKRVDLFKDHKIDLEIIMTINLFSRIDRSDINYHHRQCTGFSLIGSHIYIGELNTP